MSQLRYTRTAQGLHWAIAVMMLGLVGVGFWMHDLPLSPTKLQVYSWHKWTGVTVFMLATLRLAWRVTHPAPPLPAGISPLNARIAHAVHHLLYVLMFAIPLSGWLMSSAKGFQTVWFGVLPLPDLVAKNEDLGELLEDVHETLAITLLVLVGLHAAGALKHHFFERNGLLGRMWPTRTQE